MKWVPRAEYAGGDRILVFRDQHANGYFVKYFMKPGSRPVESDYEDSDVFLKMIRSKKIKVVEVLDGMGVHALPVVERVVQKYTAELKDGKKPIIPLDSEICLELQSNLLQASI